jgi:hypothetical protein
MAEALESVVPAGYSRITINGVEVVKETIRGNLMVSDMVTP